MNFSLLSLIFLVNCTQEQEYSIDGHELLIVNNVKCYNSNITENIDNIKNFNYDINFVYLPVNNPIYMASLNEVRSIVMDPTSPE